MQIRGFSNHSEAIETKLHIRTFVIVEQPSRSEDDFLAPRSETQISRLSANPWRELSVRNTAKSYIDLVARPHTLSGVADPPSLKGLLK